MRILFGLLLGGMVSLASAARAQTAAPPSVLEQQLDRAAQFLQAGDFEKAALLLERYYPENKANPRLYPLLKDAYAGAKDYAKLENLISERLAANPKNRDLRLDQIELLLRRGEREKAQIAAQSYLAFAPRDSFSYSTLANRYLTAGYVEEAAGVYRSGRRALLKPALFAFPLAETYRALRRWREALQEYLLILQADSSGVQAQNRAQSLMAEAPADDPNIGPFLEMLLAKKPDPLIFRFRGEWELRRGNLDAAIAAYQEADRRGSADGFWILDLTRRLAFSQPQKVPGLAGWFEKNYPQNPQMPQMLFALAEAETRLGNFEAARAACEKILTSPLAEDRAGALLASARLFLDFASRPDSALRRLEKLKELRLPHPAAEAALLEARARAARGEFDEGKRILAQISGRQVPWGEEIDFWLAEWDFYRLNFEEAEEKYARLVEAYPRGERANDALRRLALFKLFGTAPNSPLAVLAGVLSDLSQFKEKDALEKMRGLESANPVLASEALFNWGLYLSLRRRDGEAATVFQKIAQVFPQEGQAPLALEKLGELALRGGRPEEASRYYETILGNYPEAVNAESARGKLRRLGGRFPPKNP